MHNNTLIWLSKLEGTFHNSGIQNKPYTNVVMKKRKGLVCLAQIKSLTLHSMCSNYAYIQDDIDILGLCNLQVNLFYCWSTWKKSVPLVRKHPSFHFRRQNRLTPIFKTTSPNKIYRSTRFIASQLENRYHEWESTPLSIFGVKTDLPLFLKLPLLRKSAIQLILLLRLILKSIPLVKYAEIIMIHKPGQTFHQTSSYRPVSLLSTPIKVFERLPLKRI